MSSEFGRVLRVGVFGQSHGTAIGVYISGLPAGESVDIAELQKFLLRRAPGRNAQSSARSEADTPVFLSGIEDGKTCASPLCAMIENTDQHSSDYRTISDTPRPGHADFTAYAKWSGKADMRGGGHFSGRLTAPMCIAGGIAKQILARRGIFVGAHLTSVGYAEDKRFNLYPTAEQFADIAAKPFPVIDDARAESMKAVIDAARAEGDSVGGTIECAIIGLPAGLGSPIFDGVENRLAAAMFGIPAVKGIEFGAGFSASAMRGSENNDPFLSENGRVVLASNNAGGILGGITDGMPLLFRLAIKPTPSIAKTQRTVRLSDLSPTELSVPGRHDPCIAHRAVPVVEAIAACCVLDLLLEDHRT